MLQAEDSPCPHWTDQDAAKWRAMQAALAASADCLWTPWDGCRKSRPHILVVVQSRLVPKFRRMQLFFSFFIVDDFQPHN